MSRVPPKVQLHPQLHDCCVIDNYGPYNHEPVISKVFLVILSFTCKTGTGCFTKYSKLESWCKGRHFFHQESSVVEEWMRPMSE